MDDSKNRKFGIILSYIYIFLTLVIQLIYTPFLVKFLGQSEYGLYSLVNSIIGYLTILDFGFGSAIVVYITKYRIQKKYDEIKKLTGMFFIVFCIIGIVTGLIGFILYLNTNKLFGSSMTSAELEKARILMLILIVNLVVTFIFTIYSSILNSYEKFIYQKVISIIHSLLLPIVMIPLLFLGYKSITMTLVITILNFGVLFSNYIYCRKKLNIKIKYCGFDKALFKTIFCYSIWLFLSSIVEKVNYSVDQFILGIICGTTAVSVYSVATNFNNLFIHFSTAISGVMLPKMSKMVAENKNATALTNEFIKVGRLQFYVMFLATTGFILFGKEFIILWVGKEFETSYYVALCLLIPAFFALIQNLGLSIIKAKNKYKFRSITTFIMAFFNVIISIFLAKEFGPVGAALGTAISLVICNIILMNIYYYKVIKINVLKFWKDIVAMATKYVLLIVFILFLMKICKLHGVTYILIFGTIYTILYSLISYFMVMNQYEKRIVKSVLKKFRLIKE